MSQKHGKHHRNLFIFELKTKSAAWGKGRNDGVCRPPSQPQSIAFVNVVVEGGHLIRRTHTQLTSSRVTITATKILVKPSLLLKDVGENTTTTWRTDTSDGVAATVTSPMLSMDPNDVDLNNR